MKLIGLTALALPFAAGLAYRMAPRPALSMSIDIAAPPSLVWAVLMDTAAYPVWTPSMRLTGKLVPGATIENAEREGDERMIFWPKVLAVRPERELRWLGHYKVSGIFDAEHAFLLRPHGSATVFTQSETFRGVALWVYDVRQLLPSFASLNEALKLRCERLQKRT